jgi:tetratricopeptide (TPR) repeat protein
MLKKEMKTRILFVILMLSTCSYGQPAKTKSSTVETASVPQEPYFDFYQDFQKYATKKSSKYQDLYDKYVLLDSLPIYTKMTKKASEYPAPCYEIMGDGTAKTGMAYHYTFLLQMFYKRLVCLKDGTGIDPVFMKYQAFDYQNSASTKQAIRLLQRHDKVPFRNSELDTLFEQAKDHFRKADYIQSNALFSFLATVDEHYREAAINNVGLSLYHRKEYRSALYYFERAILLYPQGYLGYLNAGACKYYIPVDLGDENPSIYYFKKAYELAPDNPNVISNYKNAMKQLLSEQGLESEDIK